MLLHESFESHAASRPYAVALTLADHRDQRHRTYGELNVLANRFAHTLIESGVSAEVRVGLHLPPGVELIAAMLGIMKAGGAYVPLDPGLPVNRLAQIIERAEPAVIITQCVTAADLPRHAARLVFADDESAMATRCDDPHLPVAADDLCYVMFTSGSTGAPKGVMVTHGNLTPLFDDIGVCLDIDADDVWTAFHPFSFGFSVWEIWGALRHGGRLVIVPPEMRTDPARLFDLVRAENVTIVSQTPSAFRQNFFADAFEALVATAIRCIVLSGEAIDTGALQRWFARHGDDGPRIVNTYAITEAAGQLTFAEYQCADCGTRATTIVGRPLAHAELAIVDEDWLPVPAGRPGELFVGGPSVARGYIGSAEQTSKRFVGMTLAGHQATRWYRTGDRARLTNHGDLEFLGRTDDQVKLRGYRIELGEIAAALRGHPALDDAAVTLNAEHGGEPRLVGYVVPHAEQRPSTQPEFWPSVGPYQLYDAFLYDLMSSEAERLASYRDAFDRSVRNKVVLDIGTGEHALLARLCIDAGARKVYAVEVLDEAYRKARAFINEQGLADRIIVMHGDIASLDLPERVDVCTQGIIGNIGSADGIVPIWNSARRHFAPGCVPAPARCKTMIAAVELPAELADNPAFGPVAGRYAEQVFDRLGRRFDIRLCVSALPETAIISDAHVFEDLDFTTELADTSRGGARLTIERDARLDGYLVWTVVTTGGATDVDYRRTQRAWLPVFFPLGETGDRFGVPVHERDTIDVDWFVTPSATIHPNYRVVTSVTADGTAHETFEYLSRVDETVLNGTPLYRALWRNGIDVQPDESASHRQLRDWLAERLPEYMVPNAWVELEQLPLTSNHKLDRAALPAPDPVQRSGAASAPPRDALERDLAALWQDILNVDDIGIHDNFFDLGGDSISAVRTTSALQRLLDDAVMLIALFDAPTVAGLGEYLREHHDAAIAARYSQDDPAVVGIEQDTVPDDSDAPLSFQQQSFWVLNHLYPSMTGSNEQFVIPLDGAIDIERLEEAWNVILERHEILRTVFRETDAGVRQVVLPHRPVSIPVVRLDEPGGDKQFLAAAEETIGMSYSLADGPLIDARLYCLSKQHAKLLVNAHHIIADGLSIRVIRDELAARYAAPGRAETSLISPPVTQYRGYAIRQRAESHGDAWERSLEFWRGTLHGAPDRTALPSRTIDRAVADDQWRGSQRRVGFVIDAATADGVRELARRSSATLFMTLLAAFRVLLARYCGQEDIVIGSPVTSRDSEATRDMVGCLVNNVAFRNAVGSDESFADVLGRERVAALAALQHAGVPFERVVEALQPRRRFGEHPLFQVLFLFEDAFERLQSGGGLQFGLETLNTSRSSYWDIEFSVSDFGDDGIIRGYVGSSTARFDDSFAASLPVHFANLLRGIIIGPQTPVGSLALLESRQRREMLIGWNATQHDWPGPETLHERFAQQVALSPDATALIGDDVSLSYRELAARANQLAGQLRAQGIGPGDVVGIGVGRSIELITGIIATLQTGAAYVPLDPSYPSLRLQFIVAQTGLRMILADARLPRSVSGTLDTIRLNEMNWTQADDALAGLSELQGDGATAAYVLYTSGSTGTPKGAIGLHGGAVNRCEWMWHEYGFTADDLFCLRTSPNFVDSVWEIFGPLTHGAALRVIADADVKDPARLVERLAEHVEGRAVSHLVVVPSLLSALLDIDARLGHRLPGLRSWITSGEPLRPDLLRRFRRACPGVTLLNTYGTSETWDATCFDTSVWHEDENIVPIGQPIGNVRTHVLDTLMQPVPVGVIGELYVGGAGLGAGYLHQPELNATQFVTDPFSPDGEQPDARQLLYRTGDLARYRADGNIECLGRADRQIKLRGFRIEPDEIAAVLRNHPGVGDAVVDLRQRPGGEPALVGYWQPSAIGFVSNFQGEDLGPADELSKFMRVHLPDYMLPGVLFEVGCMPLTPSGKIDLQALPDPALANADDEHRPVPFVAPGTETEHAVAGLWREILGIDRVGLHDDFFDSGGHSLSATRLLARLRAQFDVSPDLAQFFDAPTVIGVARHIDELLATVTNAAVTAADDSGLGRLGTFARGDRVPLSFAQERLWFLNELDPDSPAYNIAFTIHLSGDLDIDVLQAAVDQLVQRHEALRTRFVSIDGRPAQEVLAKQSVPIRSEVIDGSDTREWQRRLAELSARPFALDRGPLLRLHVLQGDPQKCLLLVVIHHIVSDGLSNGIFFDELATLYDCVASGREPALPELPIQYADFALWQRHNTGRPELDAQLTYWLQQLHDAPPALELPIDRPRPAEQMFRGAWLWRELSGERAERLRSFGRSQRCTLFMVLLGAFDVLLSRYSGQADIVVGSPIAGRSWYELDGMIGLFINTVALRMNLADDPTFGELLTRVRRATLDSQANQDLPFERLVESLRPDRTLSHAPVFQVMFNMTPIPDRTRTSAGLQMRIGRLQDHGVSTFDLTLSIGERADGLDLVFEYDRDLFDRETIDRIATHYDYLLTEITDGVDTPVSALPLWPATEHAVLLDTLNPPLPAPGTKQSVIERFEARVDRQPQAVAVECNEDRLTYGELERQANQLADQLHAFGIEPGTYIAVCLERSADLLVAVLGVLKAGCAYVPMDAAYPAVRLADMFTVVRPGAMITQTSATPALSFVDVPTIVLDQDRGSLARCNASRPAVRPRPADPAYALFTSGSTGTPKAVAVTHGNLAAICGAWIESYGLTAADRHLQMAGFSFDVFSGDWVRALCSGGRLVLCPRFDLLEPARLYALLRDGHVTCAEFVPAVMRTLLTHLATLRRNEADADLSFMRLIIVGSEPWHGAEYAALKAVAGPHTRIINSYGTAETTIDSTYYEMPGKPNALAVDKGSVPIGQPFAGSRVYVCDSELRLVPPGVPGELCIGGAGVAAGYIGAPDLTAERFVADPFVINSGVPGGRLYRTGDCACYRSDGTLVLLGRMDRQVKLRGFRIEPGDIEAALSRQSQVAAVAVVVDDENNDRRLVAYIVPAQEPLDIDTLRSSLRGVLPDYMVPSLFIELDALPMTPNGKLDRHRLPPPEQGVWGAATSIGSGAAAGPIEAVLLELYRDVLGCSDIGVHDSFFDFGGHSLLATQLVSRIRDVLDVELPLRVLFEDPTIAGLVAALDRQTGTAPPPLRPAHHDAAGPQPVSLTQQRLWFLAALEPNSPAYHLHWSARLTGALDRTALSRAVDALVARHDSLRTTFHAPEGEPQQCVAAHLPVRIEYLQAAAEKQISRRLEELIALPFDLESGPLLRVHMLECEPDRHILLLVIHHLIADGWSMSVLFAELSQAYNAYRRDESPERPALPVQYADYTAWQRDWLAGEELSRQITYWREQLADAPALLELPTDRPRPAIQTHAGAWHQMTLPAELTAAIHELGRNEGCTLFMVLVAAFDVALAHHAGTTDVVIGTPIAGRSRTELEGLIGFFINTLVLRTSVAGNPTFRELLGRVKQTALDAYAHQDLPFEKLVEVLRPQRSRSANPVVQVMLTVHNQPVQPFAPDGLLVESIVVSNAAAKIDLSVHVAHSAGEGEGESDDELQLGFGYNPDLFDAQTIDEFARYYESILTTVARDVSVRLSGFGALPPPVTATDWSGNLVEQFVAQVRRAPQAIAVRTVDTTLSYQALNEAANGVAQQLLALPLLLSQGPDPDAPRIGVLCAYDERLVAGLLGILKAGCAWVPLDPAWPSARLATIAADADLAAIVTDPAHREQAHGLRVSPLPLIEIDANTRDKNSAADPGIAIAADALACIIYTSGSTGLPKGVRQTHAGVVTQIGRYSETLQLSSADRLSGLSGYAYDAAIQDIFGALLNGASVCPLPIHGSGQRLAEASAVVDRLADGAVTVIHATPSLYRYLLGAGMPGAPDLSSVRFVVLGGEVVRRSDFELYRKHFTRTARFVNGLGLTESTVALQFIADHDTQLHGQYVPVGTAVGRLSVDLVDESGESSWIGEIVLTGSGLSPGYWGQAAGDTERFGPGPSLRTGDLGYRTPDGQIVFAGRRDGQVNVRGYRVELGEIEATLSRLPGVADSAARVWQQTGHDDGEMRLAAYVVAECGVELCADDLRAALADRLPPFMLPQTIDTLDALPRLVNGKLARAELPVPMRGPSRTNEPTATPARTELEAELLSIWGDLLQLDTIGVHDDFFALGGHSLLATRVIARVRDQLALEVPLVSLFDAPTVAGLAAAIDSIRQDGSVPELTRISRQSHRRS